MRFCAIDLQISFVALAIASKKLSKTVSETCAKWLQFGAVSETQGLAFTLFISQKASLANTKHSAFIKADL